MKLRLRHAATGLAALLLALWCLALPVLAQEGNAPDPTDTPTGAFFRWLNFAIVAGGFAYVLVKYGGPYFRARGLEISQQIRASAEQHAAAERELAEAERQLAQFPTEVAELKVSAARESAAEAARIQALARLDAEKIAGAALAEIVAAERAGHHELRSIAARLATQHAEALLRARMNPAAQAALFHAFVAQLPRSAQ